MTPSHLPIFVGALALAVLPFAAAQGGCVALHCALQLAQCEIDTTCRTWSSCNTGCGLSSSSLPCQIRCADLYKPTNASSDKINKFSECVISEHHCVPQQKFNCPKPQASALSSLDLKTFDGVWYITRGLNPMFDCFDGQIHNFTVGSGDAKPLHGDLKYHVKKDLNCTYPNCDYLPREVHQSFAQDPAAPTHLINHNNTLEELHYADDWYVLAAEQDKYALVYYCGCNDATCGYSGAVLYTRVSSYAKLGADDKAAIAKAVAGAKITNFTLDGMCTPDNRAFA